MLGKIPSHSFGYYKQWHCTNDSEFLSFIISKLPLPRQHSWQGFHLSFALSMKVISELWDKGISDKTVEATSENNKSFGGSVVPI